MRPNGAPACVPAAGVYGPVASATKHVGVARVPAVITIDMWITFAVVATVIVAFAIERLPIEITALGAVVVLLALFHFFPVLDASGKNLLGADTLLQGFASPVLFTIMALLILGQSLFQTGALERPVRMAATLGRRRPQMALTIMLLCAGATSAFLNNTPVVVIFVPIVSALASRLGTPLYRLMMPLSFITILGGTTTLIGSSANLIVASLAEVSGLAPIGFFDFVIPGALMAAIGAAYVVLVLPRILRPRAISKDYKTDEGGRQFLAQIELTPEHPWFGMRAVAGLFPQLEDITVRMVHRASRAIPRPFDDFELAEGDVVDVLATRKVLTQALVSATSVRTFGGGHEDGAPENRERVHRTGTKAADLTLVEAVVSPGSALRGFTLENASTRGGIHCTIIAVQRRRRMLRIPLHHIRLEPGDVLLLMGEPQAIRALRRNPNVLMMEWSASELPSPEIRNRALVIFAATILAAASGLVPIVIAALAGAFAMVALGCLSWARALRAIDARIFLMIGTAFALAQAMQATGGAQFLATAIVETFAGYGPAALLSALFLLTAVLTNVLNNQATAALMTPLTVSAALQFGVDPKPYVYGLIIALNCSFATPLAYQTNILVMGPGRYRFSDYVAGGLPLVLIIWIAFSLFAPWYYGL